MLVGASVTLVLIVLGLPFLSARFENGDARTLPRSSEVRAAALTLSERFPARGTDPVTVVAETDATAPVFEAWLDEASTAPGVVGLSTRPGTPAGLTVVDVVPAGTSQGEQATSLVERLRSEDPGFRTQVGGPAAELADVKDRLGARLPLRRPWCAWRRWSCCS